MKVLPLVASALFVACSGDEREPPGGGVPWVTYCQDLGYTDAGETCTFTDGSSCPDVAFYQGSCGQPFSYCELHGGTIMSVTSTSNGETLTYAECTTSSGTCMEYDFFTTHQCK